MTLHPPSRTVPGFTLAEVLFAMAIFVFGVLVVVGTLPNGLASMQTARRQAAEARIFQHLRSVYQAELDRGAASALSATLAQLEQPASFLFDERGDVLRTVGGGARAAFAALAQLEPAGKLPGESDASPFLRRLRVAVSEHWQNPSALTDPRRHRQRLMHVTLTSPLGIQPAAASAEGSSAAAPPPTDSGSPPANAPSAPNP